MQQISLYMDMWDKISKTFSGVTQSMADQDIKTRVPLVHFLAGQYPANKHQLHSMLATFVYQS